MLLRRGKETVNHKPMTADIGGQFEYLAEEPGETSAHD